MAMEGVVSWDRREAWAREQFGTADLGDARRQRRLVKLAAQMAGNSSGSLPQQTGATADLKAAYRLFAAPQVTHAAVCGPHWAQTRAAAACRPCVFLVQDTTELNFTNHVHCEGLGPIGYGGSLRGLHQQNVLAVDRATRQPLGLMYQRHHRRQERPPGETRAAQRRRALRQRESYWWVQAIEQLGSPPTGVRWVHVGDRGEDIYGVYDAARNTGSDWLIRASRDRRVRTTAGPDHLRRYARGLPARARRGLTVRRRRGGPLQEVSLELAAGPVELLPSKYEPEYRGREPIGCWVVRVWESAPPTHR